MRAGILGPREVFLCSRGAVQEALLLVWAVGADCDSKPFVLPFYTPPSGSWCNLWSLMAVRLKGRGVTSTNFFKTIVSYGREVDGSWRYFDQIFQSLCFLWPWGWKAVALVRPIFPRSLTAVSVANGQSQSNDVNRSHGVSSTNCTRG
jgi:hypothetical protein